MTVHALVTGSLFRALEQRTSKNGRTYITTTVRIKDGDESLFVRVVMFSESAQTELMRLADGDSVTVQGLLKCELYTAGDGSTKVSLNIVADHVLALRAPPSERKAKAAAPDIRSRQERLAGSWSAASGDSDDSIPF
jgi:single-stranded DNA-binding protein